MSETPATQLPSTQIDILNADAGIGITLNDTCAAWLALCAQPKGAVVTVAKQTLDERIQNLAKLAGLKTWKANGLRHSFVTYHVAAYKDLPRTAYLAGNSAEVIKRHYEARASEATAARFWALRPKAAGADKIVSIKAAQ